jgi:hypothetical protein
MKKLLFFLFSISYFAIKAQNAGAMTSVIAQPKNILVIFTVIYLVHKHARPALAFACSG